jgi:type II secretory pathway pseudopilin PulG
MAFTLRYKANPVKLIFASRCVSSSKYRPNQRAYTVIELLAVTFIIAVATAVYLPIAKKFGPAPAVAATFLAILVCVMIVVALYRWSWSRDKATLRKLRENYRNIYRVTALPADQKNIVILEGAKINIGDFGWEAAPIHHNGLIHLQGLTPDWRVVWHAAFRPDEIEIVGPKPTSQYDYWRPYWSKAPPPPPCPYPIQARQTPSMDRARHSLRYFTPPGHKLAKT